MLWWILGYMYLFQLWFSSDICLGLQPLDHILTLFLIFKGISSLFFIVAAPVYIPTNSVEGSPFSTSPAFVICRLSDDGHSEWTFIISLDLGKWTFAPGLCPWSRKVSKYTALPKGRHRFGWGWTQSPKLVQTHTCTHAYTETQCH